MVYGRLLVALKEPGYEECLSESCRSFGAEELAPVMLAVGKAQIAAHRNLGVDVGQTLVASLL